MAKGKLSASPAAVLILAVQEVAECGLKPLILSISQAAQHLRRTGRMTGIDTSLRIAPDAAILLPCAENQLCSFL